MIIETRAAAPFYKNGFVLGCEETLEAVVVDPGDEVEDLLEVVTRRKLHAKHILLTHAHLDHVTGVAAAKRVLGVPVWLHRDDNFLYEAVVQQGLMFGLRVEPQPKIDRFYAAGQKIEAVAIGNKGYGFLNRIGARVVSHATQLGDKPTLEKLIGPVKVLFDAYAEGKLSAVYLSYTKFINTIKQEPVVVQLLPLSAESMAADKDAAGSG